MTFCRPQDPPIRRHIAESDQRGGPPGGEHRPDEHRFTTVVPSHQIVGKVQMNSRGKLTLILLAQNSKKAIEMIWTPP